MANLEIPPAVVVRGAEVPLDVNVDGTEPTKAQFATVREFIDDPARFDEIAREALRVEFTEKPEGTVATYLSHHAEELDEKDLRRIFNTADPDEVTIDHLLDALYLKRIGLYPDSDDYVAVFDFTIDGEATDYLLAVEFDEEGDVFGVSMDS
jgi:hypothetical protein